jgi:hypothetical protein
MDPEIYQPVQVGSGHCSSPVDQTPTRCRLCPVVRVTLHANRTVCRANEHCAKMQVAFNLESQLSEHPARPPSHALPAIPQPSTQQPSLHEQSPILPDELSMIFATREPSPCPPINMCQSSVALVSQEASVAPQVPYFHLHPDTPTEVIVGASRHNPLLLPLLLEKPVHPFSLYATRL